MNYITIAVPFFILFIALEFIYGWLRKRNTYRINDTVGSLQMGVLSQSKGFLRLGVSGLVFGYLSARAWGETAARRLDFIVGSHVCCLRLSLLLETSFRTSMAYHVGFAFGPPPK